MSTLERIEVRGFKSIREMDLKPGSLNILIGANGAGKSNLLQVFELLNQVAEGNLQVFVAQSGYADALLHFGQKVTDEIVVRLDFGRYGYEARLGATASNTLFFTTEHHWRHGLVFEHPLEKLVEGGHQETTLLGSSISKEILQSFKSWKIYHFHDTGKASKVRLTGDIGDNAIFRPDGSNLAAVLYLLSRTQRDHYDRIVRTIRLAAPFFDDFTLRPDPLNTDKIRLEWREKGSDAYFNAASLSDGTLRFMCLAVLLLQPEPPSIVLIDEPELGLHPYAITLLADMLRGAAEKTQVIVSTQSAPLVNQFEPQHIVVADREDGQSVFRRLDRGELESWLDEYGMGDLWEKNVIGGRP
jgi:predicted ATPase